MKEKMIGLVIFVLLAVIIITTAGCSGVKIYTPPYSKAEIERQKIENEETIEQTRRINEERSGPGVRIATIRF